MRNRMAAPAGRNITIARIFTIVKKGISIVWPASSETKAGREKGAIREETTTVTNTSKVEAWTRPEMKGATTPVEIPERSRTGTAYSGQMISAAKKRPTGMTHSLKRHKMKRTKALLLAS